MRKKLMKQAFQDELTKWSGDVVADDVGGKSVFCYCNKNYVAFRSLHHLLVRSSQVGGNRLKTALHPSLRVLGESKTICRTAYASTLLCWIYLEHSRIIREVTDGVTCLEPVPKSRMPLMPLNKISVK